MSPLPSSCLDMSHPLFSFVSILACTAVRTSFASVSVFVRRGLPCLFLVYCLSLCAGISFLDNQVDSCYSLIHSFASNKSSVCDTTNPHYEDDYHEYFRVCMWLFSECEG
eukprot:c36178_g1_i1 orf=87-416(+)